MIQDKQEQLRAGAIGVFDSGYGGLTILKEIRRILPEYDYIYLGDNARAPYGNRSFEVVHHFTLQAVQYLFSKGCNLVILACNTASAKALRTIQQTYLPLHAPQHRVLGVIRPTVETLPAVSRSGHVGVMATPGTVSSRSYCMEVEKLSPHITVKQQSCPMLVPLIENGEADSPGAEYFVKKYTEALMTADPEIDTILLGCTHYPIIAHRIKECLPAGVTLLPQGTLVGESLKDYLHRHPEMDNVCSKGGSCEFLTSEEPSKFNELASLFLGHDITARNISLEK
jgi:glutamate racemase